MSKILGSSKVTAKFQATIPEKVRKFLGINIGDVIAFVKENDKIYVITKI